MQPEHDNVAIVGTMKPGGGTPTVRSVEIVASVRSIAPVLPRAARAQTGAGDQRTGAT